MKLRLSPTPAYLAAMEERLESVIGQAETAAGYGMPVLRLDKNNLIALAREGLRLREGVEEVINGYWPSPEHALRSHLRHLLDHEEAPE